MVLLALFTDSQTHTDKYDLKVRHSPCAQSLIASLIRLSIIWILYRLLNEEKVYEEKGCNNWNGKSRRISGLTKGVNLREKGVNISSPLFSNLEAFMLVRLHAWCKQEQVL